MVCVVGASYDEDFKTYWEQADRADDPPIGLASFAWGFDSSRAFAERDDKNIFWWNVYETGSHFAVHDAPDLLIDDIAGSSAGWR